MKRHRVSVALLILLVIGSTFPQFYDTDAFAQEGSTKNYTAQTAREEVKTQQFTEDTPRDLLAGNYNLIKSSDLFFVWSDEFAGNDSYQKIYKVRPSDKAPPIYQLDPQPIERETGANGAYGGRHTVAASGDFNNDGFDDVVAAWAGPDNSITIMVPQINRETLDWSQATRLKAGATLGGQVIRLDTGDFDNDGDDEFALAYMQNDDRIRIELYDTNGTLIPQAAGSISNERVYQKVDGDRFDLASGDFDGNGDDELVLVGFDGAEDRAFTRVYDISDGNSNTITARGRITISLASDPSSELGAIAVATGDLDNHPNNIRDEIVVGFSYYLGGGSLLQDAYYLYTLQATQNLDALTSDQDSRMAKVEQNIGGHPAPFDLTTGDLNGDGRNEIAMAEGFSVQIYGYEPDNGSLLRKLPFSVLYGNSEIEKSREFSSNFIGIADVDSNTAEELIVASNYINDDGEGNVDQSLQFDVYRAELNASNQIRGSTRVASLIDERVEGMGNRNMGRHYALALGDFDGDGFRLGEPTYYETTDIVQPLVVLNAPPNHFDIFDDNAESFAGPPYPQAAYRDVNNCYNLPRRLVRSCVFSAQYFRSSTSVVGVTTQVKRDWSVSAEASLNIKSIFEASLKGTYGEGFSRLEGSSTTITISEEVTARTDDQVYATVIDYDVWEYPVYIRDGSQEGTLLVVSPRRIKDEWFSTKSFNAVGLETQHEIGNLLSYAEDIPRNSDVAEAFKASVYNLSDSTVKWSLQIEDFNEEQVTRTRTTGLEAKASIGFKGLGLEVNGNYSREDLNTHTISVQETLKVEVELGRINLNVGSVRYAVEPYAYWSRTGPLVVDYAVRLETAPPGQPRTWWDVHYKDKPDPAFKLPWRYDPEKGFALSDPRQRFLNWEIVSEPRNPAANEQATLRVPIYNYSLKPVSNVRVRFFQGDPTRGGRAIGDVITGIIPPRGKEIVNLDWTVPPNAGRYISIYVQIDPDNSLTEVHKNNNLSFNTVTLGCANCAAPDLSVNSAGISAQPATPQVGEAVTLHADIATSRDAVNVGVTFYQGPPSQGNRIGDTSLLAVSPASSSRASVRWDTTGLSAGDYDIWVVINEQENDPNISNNQASRTITLRSSSGPGDGSGATRLFLPLILR